DMMWGWLSPSPC
ncbi:Uncharacterized protein HZ326_31552, partial [Fusarium oxysporum f. sp. albedinis]